MHTGNFAVNGSSRGKTEGENWLAGGWSHATKARETILRILQHQTVTVASYIPFPAPSHFSSTYCWHTHPLIPKTDKLRQLKDPTRYLAQAFLQFICQPNHLYHETPHKEALQNETNPWQLTRACRAHWEVGEWEEGEGGRDGGKRPRRAPCRQIKRPIREA